MELIQLPSETPNGSYAYAKQVALLLKSTPNRTGDAIRWAKYAKEQLLREQEQMINTTNPLNRVDTAPAVAVAAVAAPVVASVVLAGGGCASKGGVPSNTVIKAGNTAPPTAVGHDVPPPAVSAAAAASTAVELDMFTPLEVALTEACMYVCMYVYTKIVWYEDCVAVCLLFLWVVLFCLLHMCTAIICVCL